MTTARWEIPSPVGPPTGEVVSSLYRRVSEFLGLRPAGWWTLLTGLVALALGLLLRWVELVVAGVTAVVMVAVALLFTIGRAKLMVRLETSDRSVVVGDRASGRILVRVQPGARHLGSRLDLPVGASRASFWLPLLAGDRVEEFRFRIPTNRRGRIVVGPAHSVQGDPFGLAGRETRWTDEQEVFVHPVTVPLPGRQIGFVHDLEGHASSSLSPADMNFHALRPYVPGDDRRHVHWRSTARTGSLMVKQFEESRMSRVLVALDTGRSSYIDDDEFELAVSVAASIVVQAMLGESRLTVMTSDDELATASLQRALDEMSLVETTATGGVQALAHVAIRRDPSASVAFLITGSTASMTDVRRAAARFDVDTRAIGVRVSTGDELRNRKAGNVDVNQVGRLEDLPRAIRRSMQ